MAGDSRRAVRTDAAPAAIGPYSQAIDTGTLVFASGQIPLDPSTGQLVEGGIARQTEQVLRNIGAVLEAAGLSLQHVVKTTIYMTDLAEFEEMNAVYGRVMPDPPPARSTVQVARLPRDVRIEIDVIAAR